VNHHVVRPDPDTEEVDPSSTCCRCQTCDVSSLARADGIDRVSLGGYGPHLDDHPSATIQGEEIELTAADVDIAADHIESTAGEVPGGNAFA